MFDKETHLSTFNELTAALHEEWNRIPQNQIQRLIQGMRRHLEAVVHVREVTRDTDGKSIFGIAIHYSSIP